MKKATITLSYDGEKLSALRLYLEQKGGTGRIGDDALTELLRRTFDLTPAGIIKMLNLRRPMFAETAARGHFGMEKDRSWEKTDRAQELLRLAGI